jgi:HSP20 family protein
MYDEFDRLFKRMSRSFVDLDSLFESVQESDCGCSSPMYYGCTVTVGPDGKPIVREYGNVKPKLSSSAPSSASASTATADPSVREPLVDVISDDKQKQVKLVAEMPGVEKSDVKVVLEGKTVHISAVRGSKKYESIVPIKYRVDKGSAKASYKNGILELVFKQLEPEKPKGKTVEVE